uniref:Uncharacterized protein n=1 Tax=Acidobacterium capsulatum TaxID=33075 RepID=A0A7V5CS79_9BACT
MKIEMIKWIEFAFLGASLAVILGLVMAGPKFKTPPRTDDVPLGAADPPAPGADTESHPQTS